MADAVGFGPGTVHKGFLYIGRPAIPWPTGTRRPLEKKVRWEGEGAASGIDKAPS